MQKHLLLSSAICSLVAVFNSPQAFASEPNKPKPVPQISEAWSASITPYLWLININGSVYYDDTRLGRANLSAGTLLSHLNFAGMVELEAHKGRFGVMADLVYSRISNQNSRIRGQVDLGSKTTVDQGIYTLAATYTVYNSPSAYVDALAGIRIMDAKFKTSINVEGTPLGLTKTKNSTTTDAVVGVKGRFKLGESDYFVPFYLDVGGGSSNTQLTSQQIIGVGRAFSWGDATVGFKNLYYKQKTGGVSSDQNLFGVLAGVTFRF